MEWLFDWTGGAGIGPLGQLRDGDTNHITIKHVTPSSAVDLPDEGDVGLGAELLQARPPLPGL